MNDELQHQIDISTCDRQSFERIQPLLPADDAELDGLIEQSLVENAVDEFRFLVFAALAANRPVDAKHLVKGAGLLIAWSWLPEVAMRMRGDVPKYLLEALNTAPFETKDSAAILAIIAIWCREYRNSQFPAEIFPKTRELLRMRDLRSGVLVCLVAVAQHTNDDGLLELLRKRHFATLTDENWAKTRKRAVVLTQEFVDSCQRPLLEELPEKEGCFIAVGNTIRRAAPRIGRNAPCPCASGRKYKRCCLEQDRLRLRRSSDIAGITVDELETAAELVFTPSRMDIADMHEVQCIDPLKLSPELLERYIPRLTAYRLFDRLAETFEKAGYSDNLETAWHQAIHSAAILGRKDVAQRLLRVRMGDGFSEDQLPLVPYFLMLEDDAEKCLAFIEDRIRTLLQSDDLKGLSELAYTLSISKFPALGIALARGVAPLLSAADAGSLMEHLLRARDRLNLSPQEAMGDVLDALAVRANEDAELSEAYREAQAKFEAQRGETRQFREQVELQRKELKRLEQAQAQAQAAAASATVIQTAAGDKTRMERKIIYLEEQLEASRREEDRRRRDMRQRQAEPTPVVAEIDREEELLLQAEAPVAQPVRILDFSRDFLQRLNNVPRHVARSTMAILGRLAGGDAAAFEGVVRLKACPSVMRHRISYDWRLMFRVFPDRVDAVDLIPRRELERRIKTLVTQYN